MCVITLTLTLTRFPCPSIFEELVSAWYLTL